MIVTYEPINQIGYDQPGILYETGVDYESLVSYNADYQYDDPALGYDGDSIETTEIAPRGPIYIRKRRPRDDDALLLLGLI